MRLDKKRCSFQENPLRQHPSVSTLIKTLKTHSSLNELTEKELESFAIKALFGSPEVTTINTLINETTQLCHTLTTSKKNKALLLATITYFQTSLSSFYYLYFRNPSHVETLSTAAFAAVKEKLEGKPKIKGRDHVKKAMEMNHTLTKGLSLSKESIKCLNTLKNRPNKKNKSSY